VKLRVLASTHYLAWTHSAARLSLVSQLVRVERSRLVICGQSLPEGEGMKIRHLLFVGLVAAFAVSLASIAVSAVAAETPFKGTFNGVETGETAFPIRSVTREGAGTATYLGSTHRT
jgi:hypothetical protein